MEYQTTKNGRRQWFKLIGDDTNPVMVSRVVICPKRLFKFNKDRIYFLFQGRCPAKEPNLSDGVSIAINCIRMKYQNSFACTHIF